MAIGERVMRHMGGSSGVLLAILLTATGEAIGASPSFRAALKAGVAQLSAHSGARTGDRTAIDALEPAAVALADGADFSAAAKAAREGAEAPAAEVAPGQERPQRGVRHPRAAGAAAAAGVAVMGSGYGTPTPAQ